MVVRNGGRLSVVRGRRGVGQLPYLAISMHSEPPAAHQVLLAVQDRPTASMCRAPPGARHSKIGSMLTGRWISRRTCLGGISMGDVMLMVHWVTSSFSFEARAYPHPMGPVPSWLACPWAPPIGGDKCASLKRGRGAAKCALKSRPQNCHFLSQARGPRGKFAKLRNLGPLARFWPTFGAIRM